MLKDDAPLPDDVLSHLSGSSAVLNHAVIVDSDRWKEALAERGLPPLQGMLAEGGRVSVSRKDIFDLGEKTLDSENALQLLYYSLAWGLGTRASRLHQRLDGLAKNPQKAEKLLVDAWTSVKREAPVKEAYGTLIFDRGRARISWLGPAFATKFLYFAQGNEADARHLILDQVVAKNLRPDAWPGSPTAAWFPEIYERYCNLLSAWAKEASEKLCNSREVSADEIEMTLFKRHKWMTQGEQVSAG
ncbi:8-oxoguanine DNA glycosylase OGG fold protein [Neomicrococcus lactis]|uniref:8-oxoguanine DNA glycosylase OGG fold protein n=1 Tax=Neomicrococcus lactis TaxID=732241 RepID=UPI0030B821A5